MICRSCKATVVTEKGPAPFAYPSGYLQGEVTGLCFVCLNMPVQGSPLDRVLLKISHCINHTVPETGFGKEDQLAVRAAIDTIDGVGMLLEEIKSRPKEGMELGLAVLALMTILRWYNGKETGLRGALLKQIDAMIKTSPIMRQTAKTASEWVKYTKRNKEAPLDLPEDIRKYVEALALQRAPLDEEMKTLVFKF